MAADQRIDLADLGLLVEVDGELLEGAFAALLVALFRLGRLFFRLFPISRALGRLGFGLARLGDAVADERNRVEPRHILLLQEEHGVAFAFGKQRDQHVGSGHFFAARALHMQDGALHHALETGSG